MLRLVWDKKAINDLRRIVDYVGERNPVAAERLQSVIERSAEQLPSYPYLYRPGRTPGTREAVVHPNYMIIYRVGDAAIVVLAVVHSRQRYP